jgi:hypothetical protein
MQIQRLQELIQFPERVEASDREGLKAWSEKYPYAGAIAMLLARASAVGGHMEQEADLLKAATHGTYRQPLYDLLIKERLKAEAKAVEQWVEEIPDAEEPTAAVDAAEEADSTPHLDPEAPMEREALIAAIGRTIEREVEPEAAEPTVQETQDMERIRAAASSPFAAWLAQRAAAVGFGEAGQGLPAASSSAETEGLDANALIDRFIEQQPRIGKLREVEAPVEEWAKASVLEDPTLVTETMARIFAQQGQIGKARKAYRHLALTYPAKSTYFAAQLKKLNQRQ